MGRKTALRNSILQIMIQQEPRSFIDNSIIDIEKDSISVFNASEKHHIFPKKYLKSIGIKEKKATDLMVNFCLLDSALNKSISGKSPKDYLNSIKENNKEINVALDSHLIPSENDSGVWTNDYIKFIDQRAELLLTHIKKRIGDVTATIEEQMKSAPAGLIQKTEHRIREAINNVFYDDMGENWWEDESIVPHDLKKYVLEKIKREKANKPYISEDEWNTPMRKLEQINIMDYLKIILKNWNKFEDIFGSKKQTEKCFDGFATIRNQINHIKTLDPTEKKFGETSIEWITKCLEKNVENEVKKESGYKPKKVFQVTFPFSVDVFNRESIPPFVFQRT